MEPDHETGLTRCAVAGATRSDGSASADSPSASVARSLKSILYYQEGGERDSMQGDYPRAPRHVQYAWGSGTGYGNRSGHSRSRREGPK